MILDCDVHPSVLQISPVLKYMSEPWRERFASHVVRKSATPVNRFPNLGGAKSPELTDPVQVAKDLFDKWNIDAGILLALESGAVAAWPDPVEAAVYVAALNDYFIEHWLAADQRYRFAFAVASHDSSRAVQEIKRLANVPGVVAIFLVAAGPLQMSHHLYYPIYAAAQEFDLPIMIHPTGDLGMYTGAPTMAVGVPRTYLQWLAQFPQVAQSHLAGLIFDGVFERFPSLKVVVTEYGFSWAPSFLWRLDAEWRNLRREVPWVKRAPSEYVRDHVRFTTQPMEEPEQPEDLFKIIEIMERDHLLLFSTDYPHFDRDNPEIIARRLPKAVQERVMSQNALETFGSRLVGVPV